MTFINRIGFPIVAFGVMAYMCFVTMKEQTKAIADLKEVFVQMNGSIAQNTDAVRRVLATMYRGRNGYASGDDGRR